MGDKKPTQSGFRLVCPGTDGAHWTNRAGVLGKQSFDRSGWMSYGAGGPTQKSSQLSFPFRTTGFGLALGRLLSLQGNTTGRPHIREDIRTRPITCALRFVDHVRSTNTTDHHTGAGAGESDPPTVRARSRARAAAGRGDSGRRDRQRGARAAQGGWPSSKSGHENAYQAGERGEVARGLTRG